MKAVAVFGTVAVCAGALAWFLHARTGRDEAFMTGQTTRMESIDLSGFPDSNPAKPLHLLFIHHSCGGQLLASPGAEVGTNCINISSVNGGGLRDRLQQAGYKVHEVSYGSRLGEKTDIFDWPSKFTTQMQDLLASDLQDQRLPDGLKNQVILFKSCFPNNFFTGQGTPPGNAAGPDLTVWNAKAVYNSLLPEFRKHPEVLFICVTAPPMTYVPPPGWKKLVKQVLGRGDSAVEAARLAREFNSWLAGRDGWLKDYQLKNVAVFDYYDILTDCGKSNFTRYPAGPGDSHPSREGNEKAAAAFVPFLNRAVHRAGLGQ